MRNQCGNVIHDTSVRHYDCWGRIRWSPECNIIQFSNIIFIIGRTRMERKTIWKYIYKMISWFKFLIEKRKWRRKFITLVIYINKQRFQAKSLFGCEVINGCVMMTLFLQPTRAENCHKLHSACISTTSGPIFTNQVALESTKWGLSTHIWDVQKQQQMTEILGHQ